MSKEPKPTTEELTEDQLEVVSGGLNRTRQKELLTLQLKTEIGFPATDGTAKDVA